MPMSVKIAGTWKTVTPFVRVAGVWKQVVAYVRVGGVWKLVSALLSVSIAPKPVSDTYTSDETSKIFGSAVAAPAGGVGPYTYAWTRLSGSTNLSADSPSNATTAFAGATLSHPSNYSAVFQCQVTDAFGATATDTVTVDLNSV